jgi:lysophospholipase L1-like esterase
VVDLGSVEIERKKVAVVVVGLAALGAACDSPRPTHVACIGDSITEGDGASRPEATYPAVLQRMLGSRTVVQAYGHSGATTLGPGAGDLPYTSQPEYGAASAFVRGLDGDARAAVVILLGTNDSKPHVWDHPARRARFIADLRALVAQFAGTPAHPTVYLVTPLGTGSTPCCGIRGDVLNREIAPAEAEVAAQSGAQLVDLTGFAAAHPDWLVDGVHPDDRGYEALASAVRDAIAAHPPVAAHPSLWGRVARLWR